MTLLQKQQYFALPPLFLAKDNPCWLSCRFIYVFTAGSLDNKLVLLLLLFNFRQHLWIQLPHHTHTETHVHVSTSVRPSVRPSLPPSVLSGCVVALTKSSVAIVWLCYCDSLLSCLIDFSFPAQLSFPMELSSPVSWERPLCLTSPILVVHSLTLVKHTAQPLSGMGCRGGRFGASVWPGLSSQPPTWLTET